MPLVPFIGPSYQSRSLSVNAQRTVNLYPEIDTTGTAKNQQSPVVALYGTPGLVKVMTVPGVGGIRALYPASDGTLYAVQGYEFYRWGTDGLWQMRGRLQTNTGPVSIADNGREVCLVDGEFGYLYNTITEAYGQITDPDFLGSQRVVYVDGYFCFSQPGTQRFYISELLAGGTFSGLDFASAEGVPDRIVGIATNQREVWLYGETSTEIWYNAGLADFPFTRVQGAILEYGCEAVHSIASLQGDLYWLGTTENGGGIVFRAQSYQAERISTHAVELALAAMVRREDAVAFGYQQEGHAFYVLTFPSANQTWVYDATTGLWHERVHRREDGSLHAWRPRTFAYWRALLLCGDAFDGRIYRLDLGAYTDDGVVIPRIRTTPHYSGESLEWWQFHKFQLDMDMGTGLDGGAIPGTTPQVMLQWSDDGGYTWSHEAWVSSGAIGQRRVRAIWRRLGQARDRVFRVTMTDPVKIAWIGATMTASRGRS